MSGRGGGRHRSNRNRGGHGHADKAASSIAREAALSLPADSPVLAMFKAAAWKLNDRQDRHERLVKLSRDITIESKRIIFLLHSSIRKEDHKKTVKEALERLEKLIKGPIKTIGIELEKSPAYLHHRALSPGFQEFIEAYTLCHLMQNRELVPFSVVQKEFEFTLKMTIDDKDYQRTVVTLLTPNDYMLGLADLTGELMRKSINSISSGDREECFYASQMVRDLYTGFLSLHDIGKELSRKQATTRNNVAKVECAMYALKVRGGEAPPSLLLQTPREWVQDAPDLQDDDEGYY